MLNTLGKRREETSEKQEKITSSSLHHKDCEELVKILVERYKKLDEQLKGEEEITSAIRHQPSDIRRLLPLGS